MIPKVIHYIWIGHKEKPQFILDCIQSWKEKLPDYEIIEWDNEKCKDILQNNIYAKEAFEAKRYAYASDVIRLHILYNYGGIYLDTDVEVANSFDEFLELEFFAGHESYRGDNSDNVLIGSAVIGAVAKNELIKGFMRDYEDMHFDLGDGNFDDEEANVDKMSRYLAQEFHLQSPFDLSKITTLKDKMILFPYFYFYWPEKGEKNYSIHHFTGTQWPNYIRKDKFSFLGFNIVQYKKRSFVYDEDDREIRENEKLLFKVPISKIKEISIIKILN